MRKKKASGRVQTNIVLQVYFHPNLVMPDSISVFGPEHLLL